MQFIIQFIGENTVLPLSYNYYVQSMIYKSIAGEGAYSSFLHDTGYIADNHCFRLFTFSCLKGRYCIVGKNIVFPDDFFLEIRTVDAAMEKLIYESFKPGSIHHLGNNTVSVKSIEAKNDIIAGEKISIRFISPVVARRVENNRSVYFSPEDQMFSALLNKNFSSKYNAFSKERPDREIEISGVSNVKKIVTQYKNSWINAFFCNMTVEGSEESLNFLYNTGLGCKNSQGFGMFRVI